MYVFLFFSLIVLAKPIKLLSLYLYEKFTKKPTGTELSDIKEFFVSLYNLIKVW